MATRPWSQEDFHAKINEALDEFATDEVSNAFRNWIGERIKWRVDSVRLVSDQTCSSASASCGMSTWWSHCWEY